MKKEYKLFFGNLELHANYSEIKLIIKNHFKNNNSFPEILIISFFGRPCFEFTAERETTNIFYGDQVNRPWPEKIDQFQF